MPSSTALRRSIKKYCDKCHGLCCEFCMGCEDYIREMDYSFLNQKPELRSKGKKGRRHAGELLLQQKVRNQAYIIKKSVIGENPISRKWSKNSVLIDDFNNSVPYSLNRKNRWHLMDGSQYLNTLREDILNDKEFQKENLKLTLAESEFTHNKSPEDRVRARHELDSSGLVKSFYSRSKRGAISRDNIKPLNPSGSTKSPSKNGANNKHKKADEYGDNLLMKRRGSVTNSLADNHHYLGPADLQLVEYMICKPHPKMFASNYFKGRKWAKSFKRVSTGIFVGRSSDMSSSFMRDLTNSNPLPERVDSEICSYESLPDVTSYSLADFVLENHSPAEFLYDKELFEDDVDDKAFFDIEILTGPENEHELLSKVDYPIPSSRYPAVKQSDLSQKSGLYKKLTGLVSVFAIKSKIDWLDQCSELISARPKMDFHWINGTKSSCFIDLTSEIVGTLHPLFRPCVLLSIIYDEKYRQIIVHFNGASSFCSDHTFMKEVCDFINKRSHRSRSINQFVEFVVELARPIYKKAFMESRTEPVKLMKGEFNCKRTVNPARLVSVYEIMELDKRGHSTLGESQFEEPDGEPIFLPTPEDEGAVVAATAIGDKDTDAKGNGGFDDSADEDIGEEEGFEVIEISDIFAERPATVANNTEMNSNGKNHNTKKQVGQQQDQFYYRFTCDAGCGEADERRLIHLHYCGHKICSDCLGSEFNRKLNNLVGANHGVRLKCLSENCEADVSLEILISTLPIHLFNQYSIGSFLLKSNGVYASTCPNCKELVCSDHRSEYKHLACNECNTRWCSECSQQPHWPLSCSQVVEWDKKLQSYIASNDLRKNSTDLEQKEMTDFLIAPKQIYNMAQHILAHSAAVRERRLDQKLEHKLSKQIGRLTDYKVKQHLVDTRKTALYLLDFGYAWLFVTKGTSVQSDRPFEWSQIKQIIGGLDDRLEALEKKIIFVPGDSSKADILEKMDDLDQICEKLLSKFSSILNKNCGNDFESRLKR